MSIPELKRAPSGVYYAHWSENRRSRRASLDTRDPEQAQRAFALWLLGRSNGTAPAGPSALVTDLWAVYWRRHVERNVAAKPLLEGCWKALEPFFREYPVSRVTQDAVEKYETWRAAGNPLRLRAGVPTPVPAGTSTVRRELVALRACLNWCADPMRKILAPAELPAFNLPPEGEPRDTWLTLDQIQALRAAGDRISETRGRMTRGHRFIWLALETAARRQAILELTWDRVDFATGMVHYRKPGQRQTKKRRVSVPISDTLLPVLKRMYEERVRFDGNGAAIPSGQQFVLDHPGDVRASIAAVAARAGVDHIHPHMLRHTAATLMARRRVPLWNVAGVLGNTLAVTEKVYAKHCPQALVDAVNNVSGK